MDHDPKSWPKTVLGGRVVGLAPEELKTTTRMVDYLRIYLPFLLCSPHGTTS